MERSNVWMRLWSDESGQGLAEYALIVALMAIGLVLVLQNLRGHAGDVFADMTTTLSEAEAKQYQPGSGA